MRSSASVKFRHNAALAVAAVITAISSLPVFGSAVPLAPLVLLPLGVAVWAWRAGTDADLTGVRVRALFGTRHIPWSRIEDIRALPRNRVVATLVGGGEITLTAVTPADMPRLVAASGRPVAEATPR